MADNKNEVFFRYGKLVICTDNAMSVDGEVTTDIQGKTFEISGADVLTFQAMLAEKKVSTIIKDVLFSQVAYIIVGENAEYKEAIECNLELKERIKEFNETRHWWERKLKI